MQYKGYTDMNELLLSVLCDQQKEGQIGEIFVEEGILELTAEILPSLTETGGEQAAGACSRQGGFTCIPVGDQEMEFLAFRIRNVSSYLKDRWKPLAVHMEQVYRLRSLQLSLWGKIIRHGGFAKISSRFKTVIVKQ